MKKFKDFLKEAKMTGLDYVIDQIVNSMEYYDEDEDEDDFVGMIQQELNTSPAVAKKVWKAYRAMDTEEKFENSAADWKEFLAGFGLS